MPDSPLIVMTEEQFERLLAKQAGLGAPPVTRAKKVLGIAETLGTQPDEMTVEAGVWALIAAGSPRLAYARALGIPFAPYMINVRATFGSTDTTDEPEVQSDVKIVQDTLVDCMVLAIHNQSATANLTVFQPEADFYFKQQSGIEATLDVTGGPRYPVAPKFTPLETMFDSFVGDSKWPRQWILTYQQQLKMSFRTTVTLPYAPIEVICTWRTYTAVGQRWEAMTNQEAYDGLAGLGITLSDQYKAQWGR